MLFIVSSLPWYLAQSLLNNLTGNSAQAIVDQKGFWFFLADFANVKTRVFGVLYGDQYVSYVRRESLMVIEVTINQWFSKGVL